MVDELRQMINNISTKFDELREYLDLEKTVSRIKEVETELAEPEIWKNQNRADGLSKELKGLRAVVGPYKNAKERFDGLKELSGIVEEDDEGSVLSLLEDAREIHKAVDKLEFNCLLGGEMDGNNAIVNINSGAGGTESCDWASMLLRMYARWAEEHDSYVEVIDQLPGEGAGIKSATFIVKGPLAYGYLKTEKGVHRLVRISPFDSNKRRHTSFASVDVIPDIDREINIEINETDLRIDTYRSSGAGGQHVNVTDSAVRITHIPTGVVSQCQNERSQHKNKATAMKILKARLYEREKQELDAVALKGHGDKKKIEWGSQIRSYVLHPYKMVKDHRTDEQTSSAEKVLDGDLDRFIEAFLKKEARG
ncbi:MAG: peptide chain release factor 2 [Candidatus Omnitrophica bacterium]|nr:peptide chain release factor 2 [Candidatus Omnitrophota bacterium]